MQLLKVEEELRTKINTLSQGHMMQFESKLRQKDESIYKLQTENNNLMSDLKNLSNMEQSIRSEIMGLNSKRAE